MGHTVDVKVSEEGDDWDTDPDFEVLHTSWIVSHGAAGRHTRPFSACFRMTCRSRSRGGERRPSRGPDARSTSGRRRTRPCLRAAAVWRCAALCRNRKRK